jgi:hypothetical protein
MLNPDQLKTHLPPQRLNDGELGCIDAAWAAFTAPHPRMLLVS